MKKCKIKHCFLDFEGNNLVFCSKNLSFSDKFKTEFLKMFFLFTRNCCFAPPYIKG